MLRGLGVCVSDVCVHMGVGGIICVCACEYVYNIYNRSNANDIITIVTIIT